MAVQRHLFPNPAPEPAPGQPTLVASSTRMSDTAPVWLQRLSLFVLVLFCVLLGTILALLPWWRAVWDDNLFIVSRPQLAAVLRSGAARGFISGLGLIDIWIGFSEAIHYRDYRDTKQVLPSQPVPRDMP